MTRTEELRNAGQESQGLGGEKYINLPWVKWGDDYNYIEGVCTKFFETKYGLCCEFQVDDVYKDSPLMATGTNQSNEKFEVQVLPGKAANLGLYAAALKGKITDQDVGQKFHVAFEQWAESKGGNRFRSFAVIPMGEAKSNVEKVAEVLDAEVVDDGLPF